MQEEEHNSHMKMGDELEWKPASCWNDLEAAIMQAKVMIYIVGETAWPAETVALPPWFIYLKSGLNCLFTTWNIEKSFVRYYQNRIFLSLLAPRAYLMIFLAFTTLNRSLDLAACCPVMLWLAAVLCFAVEKAPAGCRFTNRAASCSLHKHRCLSGAFQMVLAATLTWHACGAHISSSWPWSFLGRIGSGLKPDPKHEAS